MTDGRCRVADPADIVRSWARPGDLRPGLDPSVGLHAMFGDDAEAVHRELVHTLGDLTLAAYNSELSNKPLERTQQIWGDRHLSLNKDLVAHSRWCRSQIETRAAELAERANKIWPAPVAGVADAAQGFDWSRMHAAIAAIPDRRWTSYADLAARAGTAAQAVGNRIASNPSLAKAYHVMTIDGRVSEGFAWSDPTDSRDPIHVLRAEGVQFDETGRATAECRLTADTCKLSSCGSTPTTICRTSRNDANRHRAIRDANGRPSSCPSNVAGDSRRWHQAHRRRQRDAAGGRWRSTSAVRTRSARKQDVCTLPRRPDRQRRSTRTLAHPLPHSRPRCSAHDRCDSGRYR